MDNSEHNYNVMFARQLYKQCRLQGCPVMITFKTFHNDGGSQHCYFVESKDGLYSNENINACCAWEAKFIGAGEWMEMKGISYDNCE